MILDRCGKFSFAPRLISTAHEQIPCRRRACILSFPHRVVEEPEAGVVTLLNLHRGVPRQIAVTVPREYVRASIEQKLDALHVTSGSCEV